MTILSNIPISDPLIKVQTLLSVTGKKEQEETRLWLHHTLVWVLAFSGVWSSAGLWLQKKDMTLYCGGLWWLSTLSKSSHWSTILFQIAFNWMNLFCFVHCASLITKLYLIKIQVVWLFIYFWIQKMISEPWSYYRFPYLLRFPKTIHSIVYILLIQSAILEHNCCIFTGRNSNGSLMIVMILFPVVWLKWSSFQLFDCNDSPWHSVASAKEISWS